MTTPPRPRPIILDFDGTITTKDTITTLAHLAITHQASHGLNLQPAWETIVSSYSSDFSSHIAHHHPTKEERKTLKQEIEYYRSLKEVETKSFDRVSASGIFKGIRATDERAQYAAIIDDILASADLQTVSAKQVRTIMAARLGVDLERQKSMLQDLITERFDVANKAAGGPDPSITTKDPPKAWPIGEWHCFGVDAVRDGLVEGRKGIKEFGGEMTASQGALCGVVSVNFSRDFVKGVVSAFSPGLAGIDVVANVPNAAGVLEGFDIYGEGRPKEVIATSDGKLAAMKELLGYWRKQGKLNGEAPQPIYAGDSGTDLECLMEDGVIGIVMTEDGQSALMETLTRICVKVMPIGEFRESEEKSVYWARDFTEVMQSPLFSKPPEQIT
ncbi:hypothetical protein LOCC1_G003791 [Lachnellula occidentalis]|uniref:DEK-C domain-containing protein n=1 Tax=Lachnellula occidentalis TaxID=215460 RepID=A0A8H8UGX5_9HELO|nr:hypothetical protein LOCC1_G003791 [Lachnellula occidentalis]